MLCASNVFPEDDMASAARASRIKKDAVTAVIESASVTCTRSMIPEIEVFSVE